MSGSEKETGISQSQFLKYAEDLAAIYGLERQRRLELQHAYDGISDLIQSISDGAIICNQELIIQEANKTAGHILNISPEKLEGAYIPTVLPHLPETGATIGPQQSPSTYTFTSKAGRSIRVTPSAMKNGWFFFLFHDVTREMRVENLKNDFLAMLSHELRTPLTGILGFAEILLQAPGNSEDLEEALECIKESGRRMLSTIEELLRFADLQSKRLDMVEEPLQLPLLIHDVISSLDAVAQKHEVSLYLTYNNAVPPIFHGNQAMLRELFYQVIKNSIIFGNAGGVVSISLVENPQNITVTVEDNGIGIPADELERVFDSFYQVEECIKRNQDGLGLGLSITRLITELQGGTISIRSKLNVGTTITILLPNKQHPRDVQNRR